MNVLEQNTKWDCWTKIKQFFCIHDLHIHSIDDIEIVCWHWIRGEFSNNDSLFIEIQLKCKLKCKYCDSYYFRYIYDRKICDKFAAHYKDKIWSATCKPVLDY